MKANTRKFASMTVIRPVKQRLLPRNPPKVESKLALSRPEESFFEQVQESVQITAGVDLNWTMGRPNDAQLALMNRYKPKGLADYQAEELVTIPWLASHTLMQHGGGVWSPEALMEMAYGSPGCPVLLDHDWDSTGSSVGFIYEAHIIAADSKIIGSSPELEEIMWASAGQYVTNNLDVIKRNGGAYLMVLETAHEASSPFVDAVRFNRVRSCSTGCLLASEESYVCPICTDEQGGYVPFSSDDCEHLINSPFLSWFVDVDDEEVQKRISPYVIKHSVSNFIEVSAVSVPGLPGARRL